jgi:hypothetical protein
VEDAIAGVQGARSAGMRSIGVSHHGKLLPADLVTQSLDQLRPDAFEKLLDGCYLPQTLDEQDSAGAVHMSCADKNSPFGDASTVKGK